MTRRKDALEPSGEFEPPPDDVVPGHFVVARPKREPETPTLASKLEALKHEEVEVFANGVTYRGVLQGSDEEYVYLRTELRHVQVLMERISRVEAVDQKPAPLAQNAFDPSFFEPPQEPEEP